MTTRREFIAQSAVASIITASTAVRGATEASAILAPSRARAQENYNKIRGLVRREDTIVRHGPVGSGFAMTWTADDRQFVSALDVIPSSGDKLFHSRMYTVSGDARAAFED